MTYTTNNYQLIEAQDNAMNYIILRERGGDWRSLCIDWDLSEEEVNALVDKFTTDGLTDSDIMNENKEFSSDDTSYNEFKVLA